MTLQTTINFQTIKPFNPVPFAMKGWLECETSLVLALQNRLLCEVGVRPSLQKEVGLRELGAYETSLIQTIQTNQTKHFAIFKRQVSLIPKAQTHQNYWLSASTLALIPFGQEAEDLTQPLWLEKFHQLKATPLTKLLFDEKGRLQNQWSRGKFEFLKATIHIQTQQQSHRSQQKQKIQTLGRCAHYQTHTKPHHEADFKNDQANPSNASHLWVAEFFLARTFKACPLN